MASVFSSYAASFYFSSNQNDRLTPSLRAGHSPPSPHSIPDSGLTSDLIRPLICCDNRETLYPQRTSLFHGTAAHDADEATKQPRRLQWHPPTIYAWEFHY